jgi:nicotinamidase-related amidase
VKRCALIVVDVQRGFDDPQWGPRNNLACESNIEALIAEWRATGRPLVYVRHDSTDPGSPLAPGTAGNAFKDTICGEPDLFVTKQVNSAFYGEPPLDPWLRAQGIHTVAICGITTNHCCETTARMAANLGYRVLFVGDATHTFDRAALDGTTIPADVIQRVTEANLQGEFAEVTATATLLADAAE